MQRLKRPPATRSREPVRHTCQWQCQGYPLCSWISIIVKLTKTIYQLIAFFAMVGTVSFPSTCSWAGSSEGFASRKSFWDGEVEAGDGQAEAETGRESKISFQGVLIATCSCPVLKGNFSEKLLEGIQLVIFASFSIRKERICLTWDRTHGFPFQTHTVDQRLRRQWTR